MFETRFSHGIKIENNQIQHIFLSTTMFCRNPVCGKMFFRRKNYNVYIIKYLILDNKILLLYFIMNPRVGLGAFMVERSFFPENERNDQERPHRSEKKRTLRTRS